MVEAGGSNDRRDLARTVRFPRADSAGDTIHVEGNAAVVDKIIASIESFVGGRENQATETLEIAPEKHRLLIGRGGETRRALESQFRIKLDIPKLSQEGPNRSHIKLEGQPANLEQAKAHILDLVKDQEGVTVQVPRRLHHAVSNNGQFFRRLRTDQKVSVHHAGERPPARPSGGSKSRQEDGRALPLITDQEENPSGHSWETIDNNDIEGEDGDIPWVLHGPQENLARAQNVLQKAIEQAQNQQQSSIGYLVLPDPRTYRFVIGQGGSQINAIRRQTGCKITVPREQTRGEAIEIVGSRDGIEQAKDIILETVQNGSKGRLE